eukprot:scaffold1402_cov254-Pinguiococcus_pyrenoidosus.AAC.25
MVSLQGGRVCEGVLLRRRGRRPVDRGKPPVVSAPVTLALHNPDARRSNLAHFSCAHACALRLGRHIEALVRNGVGKNTRRKRRQELLQRVNALYPYGTTECALED